MRIAYLDCASGISGDMTLGALVDAGVELAALQAAIDSLGLPKACRLVAEQVKKKGFRALKITVEHEPEHAHRHLHHIVEMIQRSRLTERQKGLAEQMFRRVAEAEAKVHGTTIEKVHFHEVGAVDSIADIVGAAVGWDLLGVEQIVCSPVPTGRGFVQIAHGRCAIPAPATAELLAGVPLAESEVEAELTTPTGAAIVATLADRFGPLPAMTIENIGYGAGTRDLEQQANLLRLFVGTSAQGASGLSADRVVLLETNLDDTTGEVIGHCIDRLWQAGALDVYTTPIQMKKHRPGVVLSVLCQEVDAEAIARIMFRETGTLGIRRESLDRWKQHREPCVVETPWGPIEGKRYWFDDEAPRFAPEYEACRRVALENNVALADVQRVALQAYEQGRQVASKAPPGTGGSQAP